MFKPNTFSTPMLLKKPTYTKNYGVETKTFTEGVLIFGSFKTYGGTERDVNGVWSVEDTAVVETWYRPDITSECVLDVGGSLYQIWGEPENIDKRNQFLRFKVRRYAGGA